jgi:hypothetical protein
MAARTPRVAHTGRTTTVVEKRLSKATLEFCDWLIDTVTLSTQAPDFEAQAKRIVTAQREVTAALIAAGGVPIATQRTQTG